jgi:hypothetical protein
MSAYVTTAQESHTASLGSGSPCLPFGWESHSEELSIVSLSSHGKAVSERSPVSQPEGRQREREGGREGWRNREGGRKQVLPQPRAS